MEDTWERRSHILAPITDLVGKEKQNLEWTNIHQKVFDDINRIMTRETIINYPKFGKTFDIHTDASDRQLGAVISRLPKIG